MKIHLPSLGIGAGAVITAIIIITLISGPIITKTSEPVPKTVPNTQKSSQTVTLGTIVGSSYTVLGSKDAPITMVEFGDYQCFYCHKFFTNTESDIVKNYVDTGKVKMIFRDFTIIGQDSVSAAVASHCAQEQGKFWEYHDALYTKWQGENTGWASTTNLSDIAKQVGLNGDQFNSCLSQAKYGSLVQGSVSDARNLGLTGTPDFFIISADNSVTKVVGAQPYDVFDKIFKSKIGQ